MEYIDSKNNYIQRSPSKTLFAKNYMNMIFLSTVTTLPMEFNGPQMEYSLFSTNNKQDKIFTTSEHLG